MSAPTNCGIFYLADTLLIYVETLEDDKLTELS